MAWFAALQVYSATSSVDVIVTLYCDRVMTRDFTQSAPDRGALVVATEVEEGVREWSHTSPLYPLDSLVTGVRGGGH